MKRVFVVCDLPLLEQGLERLIGAQAGVEVVGRERDPEKAYSLVVEQRPDVVIVGGDDCGPQQALLVLRLLRAGMCERVITLNLQDNVMHIYRGEERAVGGIGDMMAAIR